MTPLMCPQKGPGWHRVPSASISQGVSEHRKGPCAGLKGEEGEFILEKRVPQNLVHKVSP